MKRVRLLALIVVLVAGGAAVGFLWWPTPTPYQVPPGGYSYNYGAEPTFKDDVATNVQINADALNLDFVDRDGKPRKLGDYRDKKNVVLVFMRGMTKDPGGLCPTCSAQTSRLLANYSEFAKRDTELLVIFPGPKNHVTQFVEQTQAKAKGAAIPFPILFDEDFQAVDRLGIRADSAKPATFVLDKEGQVRFAYVGATSVDRPSMAALYKQMDALEPPKK